VNPLYEAHLAQASGLKLRAVSARGRGGDGVDLSAILLHEAERAEQRALLALGPVDRVTRLRAAVERCGLLVEARDVTTVLSERWPEVLDLADACGPGAAPLLARLRPAVEELRLEYRQVARDLPEHFPSIPSHVEPDALPRLLAQARRHAARFPGDWRARLALAQFEDQGGDHEAAWAAVRAARAMAPEAVDGLGVELRVALSMRDPARLRASLDAAADRLAEGALSATLALHVAAGWATLALTDPAARPAAAAEASRAVARGLAAEPADPLLRRCLRAMSLLVAAVRDGEAPDPSLLARAGLHDLAARLDGPADPLTLLRYADPPRAAA